MKEQLPLIPPDYFFLYKMKKKQSIINHHISFFLSNLYPFQVFIFIFLNYKCNQHILKQNIVLLML